MEKVSLNQLDEAVRKLEEASKSLLTQLRIAQIQKLITVELIKSLYPDLKTDSEVCPECSTPLSVKRERGEIPGLIREYAECLGCGYLET